MDFAAQVDERLHNLAKPPGSLGLLEQQVRQVFLAWGSFQEELRPRHIIFAADNGVVRSGVVAQLSDITYMQSVHMTEGTSAVTCFCRCHGIPYEVVDAEKNWDLVQKYGVMQAPTLVVVENDQAKKYVNASNIKKYVEG